MFGKKNLPTQFRQGDVFIRRISPKEKFERQSEVERDNGRVVLAYGEVTGHAHAIADPGVVAWGLGENRMLLEVPKEGATLRHEEHLPIELPPGEYEVVRQREFTGEDERRWAWVAD